MRSHEFGRLSEADRRILDKYLGEAPVRVGALANELGVAIKVSALPTGVSGQISNVGGDYVIRVNRHEARERQRFTIAHELAHFLMHRPIIDSMEDGITDTVLYRSGAPERIEYEANRLGADIVMPMDVVHSRLTNEYGGVVSEASIAALADDFQVSKAAMEIQLSKLGAV